MEISRRMKKTVSKNFCFQLKLTLKNLYCVMWSVYPSSIQFWEKSYLNYNETIISKRYKSHFFSLFEEWLIYFEEVSHFIVKMNVSGSASLTQMIHLNQIMLNRIDLPKSQQTKSCQFNRIELSSLVCIEWEKLSS